MGRKRPKPQHPPEMYINRELSWLEFDARVLEEAEDTRNPLLERVKFLAIFSSNLDEFFEVRVAGLQQQVLDGAKAQDSAADGLDAASQLTAIDARAHGLVARQCRALAEQLLPALAAAGIRRLRYEDLDPEERHQADGLFDAYVYPVLTPLAIDPGHPFPHVHNKSLNLAVHLEPEDGEGTEPKLAVVQVPTTPDRLVVLSQNESGVRFLLLEDLVAAHLQKLFSGYRVLRHAVFRVTRNTDLTIPEKEAEDLLEMIEESLRQRLRSDPVRLEIAADADQAFAETLAGAHDLQPRDVYRVDGPVDLTTLWTLARMEGFRELHDEPHIPRFSPAFADGRDVFETIRQQDVLVHHPYESFGSVVDFIERAADDPDVLAIKQTLYRTSVPSAIITALGRAAQNGKQVTALVELKARYDEQNNILWARSLERAGVHVVYGVVGLKTHCKAALVVRREPDGIRRYLHLGTGNYNQVTARLYTDLGLFTCEREMGEDATALFNLLTGYSREHEWKRLWVAPVGLREKVVALIDRERLHAAAGLPSRIIVKMNALVEPSVIDALYAASQSGVRIDLIIRGICCLRPGLPGISENIRVVSIVDKFLEHTRVFYFENAGDPEVFLGSADWMPRNFFRRIEVDFPIRDPKLKQRIIDEILAAALADDVKARELRSDGSYVRRQPADGERETRSQVLLQDLARGGGREDNGQPSSGAKEPRRRGRPRVRRRRTPTT